MRRRAKRGPRPPRRPAVRIRRFSRALASGAALAVLAGSLALAAPDTAAASGDATLSLSPDQGTATTATTATLTVTGAVCDGYGGKADIALTWDSVKVGPTARLGPPTGGPAGPICTTVFSGLTAPAAEATAGAHTITAAVLSPAGGQVDSASAQFTISASAGPSATPGTPQPPLSLSPPPSPAAKPVPLQVSASGPGSVTSRPLGIDCKGSAGTCLAEFPAGSTVTLTAATAGSAFAGWGGACRSAGTKPTCSLALNAATRVTAAFTATGNPPRSVSITPPNGPVTALGQVPFTASGAGAGSTYAWDFEGTGHYAECPATAPIAFHAFTHAGTFRARLQVRDSSGAVTSTARTVTVAVGAAPKSTGPPAALPASAADSIACAGPGTGGNGPCVTEVLFDNSIAKAVSGCFSRTRLTAVRTNRTADEPALQALAGTGASGPASAPGTYFVGPDRTAPPPMVGRLTSVGGNAGQDRAVRAGCLPNGPCMRPVGGALDGLFATADETWVASGAVLLNGLLLKPAQPNTIVLSGMADYLDAPQTTVEVAGTDAANGHGPLTLAHDMQLVRALPDAAASKGKVALGSFPNIDAYLPHLFGFGLTGVAKAYLVGDTVQVTVNVELPNILAGDAQGDPITGKATLIADNDTGLHLQNLDIELPQAYLGAIQVENLHIRYDAGKDLWDAGGSVYAIDVATVTGDVAFRHGSFDHGSAGLQLVDPGVPVLPPVLYLNEIDFAVSAGPPPTLQGGITLTAGGSYSTPFGTESAAKLSGRLTFTDSRPWVLSAQGSLAVAGISLAGGQVSFDSDGNFSFGGRVHVDVYNLGVLTVDGAVSGGVYDDGSFGLDAGVSMCVFAGCEGGEFVVSSKGVAGCAAFSAWGFHLHAGAGYSWGGSVDIMADSCGVGPWQVTGPQNAAYLRPVSATGSGGGPPGGAPPGTSLALAPGPQFQVIGVQGTSAPPEVTVTGPDGSAITTAPGPPLVQGHFLILTSPRNNTTYVVIGKPAAGTWTVRPAPGAAPFVQVQHAAALPAPQVSASVSSLGDREYALDYRVTPQPGMSVRFVEVGAETRHVLGTADSGAGVLRFTPGDGVAGQRSILAEVSQNGLPRTTLTVARYAAPGRLLPPVPAPLQVVQTASAARLSWGASRGAVRYAVLVHLADGQRSVTLLPGSARSATLAGLYPVETGTVQVAGVLTDGTFGPFATAELGSTARSSAAGYLAPGATVVALLLAAVALVVVRRRRSAAAE